MGESNEHGNDMETFAQIFIWFYKGLYIQELNANLDDFITIFAVLN